jgi:cyanate lyase
VTKIEMTEMILSAKKASGKSWEEIAAGIGMSSVWTTSACLGMNSMVPEQAKALCETLDLPEEVGETLQAFPHKHWDKAIPTDPLIYRFYEMINVYGDTMKELIHEKLGDGIMSAIDFTMDIQKEENPAGDRVVIVLNGKFLPYKSW